MQLQKGLETKQFRVKKTDRMTQSKRGDQNNTSYLPTHGTAD